jgi:hypothetical protein
MSRENIASMGWVSRSEFHVTFNARNGERTYSYDPISGAAIAAGGDPRNYNGVEVSGMDYGTLVEDVAEVAELLL